jgi:hypothetical protein
LRKDLKATNESDERVVDELFEDELDELLREDVTRRACGRPTHVAYRANRCSHSKASPTPGLRKVIAINIAIPASAAAIQ